MNSQRDTGIAGRSLARIRLSALRHNLQVVKRHAPGSPVAAVVKANAYGHGLLPVAEALRDADLFAVTDLNEAQRLATAGLDKPILILQGFMQRAEIGVIAEAGFQLLVHSLEQLALLEEELDGRSLKSPLTLWLKMDSGMGRLGIPAADYLEAYRKLAAKPWASRVIMTTHLANASLPDDPLTAAQLQVFEAARVHLPDAPTSVASSAGILATPPIASGFVRPGIMLYGSSPYPFARPELRAERFDLQPVMTLQSKLIAVKALKAGENVGYCSQFVCPQDMTVGIVALGYADGYPSHAPNGTPLLVDGRRSHTLGRVSMDMLAVDLSHLPDARPGAPVTLWGEGLSVDEVAAVTGVISYNLLCSVSPRVHLRHV